MSDGGADTDRCEGCEILMTERAGLGVEGDDRKEDRGSRASGREERLGLDARERTWRELI